MGEAVDEFEMFVLQADRYSTKTATVLGAVMAISEVPNVEAALISGMRGASIGTRHSNSVSTSLEWSSSRTPWLQSYT